MSSAQNNTALLSAAFRSPGRKYHITKTKKSLVLLLYSEVLCENKTVFSRSLTFPILNYITTLRENSWRLGKEDRKEGKLTAYFID
jgi:hypothetical protein